MATHDRVGLGWRSDLASGILTHLDAIDALEVIAENITTRDDEAALRELGQQVPLHLHGVSLGLASAHPAPQDRIAKLARWVDRVRPTGWSEHLAFVRAGGHEIGHLAAPPRTSENVAGTLANIARAATTVGIKPALENIASLIEPPGSTMDEAAWLTQIIAASGAPLLLDLHNLYADAVNFGRDPLQWLDALPLACVTTVHLSGGVWLDAEGSVAANEHERVLLLDDHLHDVPPPVFVLLEALAARVPTPLTVIIERDGRYPHFDTLLSQIGAARQALARGRAQAMLPKAA